MMNLAVFAPRGDGCEVTTLVEAGASRADMFVAVTGEDQHNLVACQLAKHKFKVPRTIARIKNPKNEGLFKKLGIDVTISSTDVILEHITESVPTHPLTHLMDIPDRGSGGCRGQNTGWFRQYRKNGERPFFTGGQYAVFNHPQRPKTDYPRPDDCSDGRRPGHCRHFLRDRRSPPRRLKSQIS